MFAWGVGSDTIGRESIPNSDWNSVGAPGGLGSGDVEWFTQRSNSQTPRRQDDRDPIVRGGRGVLGQSLLVPIGDVANRDRWIVAGQYPGEVDAEASGFWGAD